MSADIENIAAMLKIGQLAMDHWIATRDVVAAKHSYWQAIELYEEEFGEIVGKLSPHHPDHANIIADTKPQFDAYKAAKRAAYNLKRRLDSACRNTPKF